MSPTHPHLRLRRLRANPVLRDMVQEHTVTLDDLVYPIFIEEGLDQPAPVDSMPGIERIPESQAGEAARAISRLGIRAVMTFGVSRRKDETGSDALRPDGLVARMTRRLKDAAPELLVIADTCFCEYTSHGHCGVLHRGDVDNDRTIANLGRQAVIAAEAGADIIAPSAMMDGQVRAIRAALDGAGRQDVPIMAYSSKFASSFYGPFRAAAGCELQGDRKTYQMNPLNGREALRESDQDEAEGADMLMVKPALPYLDVLAAIRRRSLLPLAAYQVSGEYAMIKFASRAGALDERRAVRESLGAIKRAGADLIMTYFAPDIAREGV